jgi:hypothetical protein
MNTQNTQVKMDQEVEEYQEIRDQAQKEEEPTGVLARLFNKSRPAKILDFIIENKIDSYTIPEISRSLNISLMTTFGTIKKFERLGLVKVDRVAGNTRLYKYNEENEAIKLLDKASLLIASKEIDEELRKQQRQSR